MLGRVDDQGRGEGCSAANLRSRPSLAGQAMTNASAEAWQPIACPWPWAPPRKRTTKKGRPMGGPSFYLQPGDYSPQLQVLPA